MQKEKKKTLRKQLHKNENMNTLRHFQTSKLKVALVELTCC